MVGAPASSHVVPYATLHRSRAKSAEAEGCARVPAEDEDADAEERGGDHLARAVLLAREERRGHAAGERHPGDMVAQGAALVGRVAARRHQRCGDAGTRPEGADRVGGPVALPAPLALAGD